MKRRKKPRNINDVFDECDRMWRSIKRSVQRNPNLANVTDIQTLKWKWLDRNGYCDITYDCFFCDYAEQRSGLVPGFLTHQVPHNSIHPCIKCCPGRKVDPDFLCKGLQDKPTYHKDPIGFANWISRLNRKRKRVAAKRRTGDKSCLQIQPNYEHPPTSL